MSGHSKWHSIKHKKGIADQKRGTLFTKLGNAITVAARQGGGNPETNFSLRLAIEKAKQNNMPKENIERAIKRGEGNSEGTGLEEVIYEGFGPDKVSIIIQCLTDNRNRTAAEIKHLLEGNGGSLAGPGSVMWQFEKKGRLTASVNEMADKFLVNNNEELELKLIDLGIEDVEFVGDEIIIFTKLEEFQKIKSDLEKMGVKIKSADIEFVPKKGDKKEIDENSKEKIKKLFNELDNNDDVSNYYTNLK